MEERKRKLNSIASFNTGKPIYKGEYWRQAFEKDDNLLEDNKFFDDIFLEIDSLGLYMQME